MWNTYYYTVRMVCLLSCVVCVLVGGPDSIAASSPPPGEIISRCEDRTFSSQLQARRDDGCPSLWSEERQYHDRAVDETEPWSPSLWGPYEMSEFELSLLYRPGERRPLWGY